MATTFLEGEWYTQLYKWYIEWYIISEVGLLTEMEA
jgi:hypothetical protein